MCLHVWRKLEWESGVAVDDEDEDEDGREAHKSVSVSYTHLRAHET